MVALTALAITTSGATAAHAAPSKEELKKQIDKASDKLEDVTEAYNKMRLDLKKTKADAVKLSASLKPAQAALVQATSKMQTIATTSYITGRVGPMTILLSGDQDSVLQRMSYLDQISKANQQDIDTYTDTTQTFTDRQAALKTTEKKQGLQVQELSAQKTKIKKDLDKLLDMRETAFGSPTESSGSYTGEIPNIPGSAGKAVTYAFGAVGKPYGFGDAGPNSYDCSGLTLASWAAAGKSLPHNAAAQYSATARISKADLQPGDLVFYRSLGHVALYVGGGMIIDAPSAGRDVLHRSINIMTPYGYGRVK
ncbi:D-gamma-glutamyl-meso-diaminopimelic acid endopeptidase [Actinoplanes awajinensis subsp. mycoplanecinus]|uniref:D-gamma-glutamyl-meso-diaminopimelic acid endopeptidase n=1 Tax=Actinoplanes awajinensis subsp. mycoplanecinus TaxID=135947 RepID=A0A101JQ18_9ACTN|nr:D-gamma-glutamyl-meso-diaminopimelic acid endopeptidase [Actinoplanes awajinensis subsp. mycoplanecinus]